MSRSFALGIFGLALVFAMAICGAGPVFAGTDGKITGKVADQNGEALPGVNVVLAGTNRGASTGPDGRYFILSVAPGSYSMTASIVGYTKQTMTEVEARADFTTTVDFTLNEAELALAEITVVSERPAVEPDKVVSKYVVGLEEIAMVPMVRNVADLVELQPGVDLDGNNVIRGGSAVAGSSTGAPGGIDVNYIVDGIRLSAKGGPGDRAFSKFNKSAVQELTVITGGMAAEYGDVQAGVINVVVREGSKDYHGSGEYRAILPGKKHWGVNVYDHPIHRDRMRWNDPAWANELHPLTGEPFHMREDYTGLWGHFAEGSLSGPLTKKGSFFLSTAYIGEPATFPGPTNRGFRGFPEALTINMSKQFIYSDFNIQNQWKFGWDVTPNLRLKTGGFFERHKAPFTLSYWGRISWTGQFRGSSFWDPTRIRDSYRDIFIPRDMHNGMQINRNNMLYLSMTHMLTPKTFYELKISQYSNVQDSTGVRWDGFTRYPRSERRAAWRPRYDNDEWFMTYWTAPNYSIGEQIRQTLKFDLSSQVTEGHFIKTGLEITRYGVWWVNTYNGLTTSEVTRYISELGVDAGDGRTNIFGYNPNSVLHPWQSAWYIQDKMEFEGMVVNVGVRYDRWDHNTYHTPIPMAAYGKGPMIEAGRVGTGWPGAVFYGLPDTDPEKDLPNVPLVRLGHIQAWSPRLGISHPITANAAVHYSYGIFRQTPTFWDMYGWSTRQNRGLDFDRDGDRETNVEEMFAANELGVPFGSPFDTDGNRLMPFPTTTSFEVGMDWNFLRDYTLRSAVYYKSAKNQMTNARSRFWDPAGEGRAYGGITLAANGHSDTRGFEMGLRKRFSDNFSFQISFNQMWATSASRNGDMRDQTVQFLPDSTFIVSEYYWWDRQFVDTNGDGVLDDVEPVFLSEAEKRNLGHKANERIRSLQNGTAGDFDPSQSTPPELVVDEDYGKIYLWQALKKVNRASGIQQGQGTIGSDRHSTGSVQFFFSTPPDFGPKTGKLSLLGNIRANLVYRIRSGRAYGYTPPTVIGTRLEGGQSRSVATHEITFEGQEAETRSGPFSTRTDLLFEKLFSVRGETTTSLFVNVANLFNQRDLSQLSSLAFNGSDYTSMGVDRPRPDDKNYLKWGDDYQTIRYEGQPRQVEVGFRVSF